MENVFEELLANSTDADDTQNITDNDVSDEGATYDDTYDLDINELSDEDNSVNTESEEEETPANVTNEESTPTNAAFAQMRTQNKEFQEALNELNELAKSAGLKDYKDLIAKGKEAQIKREAKSKGIPLEVARELEEMRALKEELISEREENEMQQRERIFVSNVQEFVKENNLAKPAINRLSQDLERDGLSVDTLMSMPKTALNRILNSYIGADYQKNLERKSAIRKELPINQSSKIDAKALNKDIDDLAKQLAGKI